MVIYFKNNIANTSKLLNRKKVKTIKNAKPESETNKYPLYKTTHNQSLSIKKDKREGCEWRWQKHVRKSSVEWRR